MKKLLLFTAFLGRVVASDSQVLISILLGDKLNSGKMEFGLEGGINWSIIQNLEGAKRLAGFNLGFYMDIKLKNTAWTVNTGVIVKSPMGAGDLPPYSLNNAHLDTAFSGGGVTRKLSYSNVPIMMKYKFNDYFFVKGGIQLGLRNKAFDEFSNSVKDKDDLKQTINVRDQFHPLDAGLAFGVVYRLMSGNGMNLSLQYYHGLVDVVVDDFTPRQFNRVYYFTVGIPIGKNAKKKVQSDE